MNFTTIEQMGRPGNRSRAPNAAREPICLRHLRLRFANEAFTQLDMVAVRIEVRTVLQAVLEIVPEIVLKVVREIVLKIVRETVRKAVRATLLERMASIVCLQIIAKPLRPAAEQAWGPFRHAPSKKSHAETPRLTRSRRRGAYGVLRPISQRKRLQLVGITRYSKAQIETANRTCPAET